MLDILFLLIVFPCIVAFIIGFLTYQNPGDTPPNSPTLLPSPDEPTAKKTAKTYPSQPA